MFERKASRAKWWSRPDGAGAPGAGSSWTGAGDAPPGSPAPNGAAPGGAPAAGPAQGPASGVPGPCGPPERADQAAGHAVAGTADAVPDDRGAAGPPPTGATLVASPAPEQNNPYATPAGGTPVPAFRPDPYGTPPYGRPGPYAPAPPVQHPNAQHTPPQIVLPPQRPLPAGPPPQPYAPWQRPWGQGPAVRQRSRTGRLVLGAVALALTAGVLGGGIGAAIHEDTDNPRVEFAQAPPDEGARAPGSVAGIAASTLPGVVYIHVRGDGSEATGTGFILDAKGHILTNHHVVESAMDGGDVSVTFNNGDVRSAEIIGGDSGYDLAVIKVTGARDLRPLTLGDSDSVQVGDPVVAIGAPYDLEGTVTSGIISAKDRPIAAGGEEGSDISYVNALQTDAPINPGNSGGPLVNARGQVIGINSAIRSADNGSDSYGEQSQGGSIGLGFAIPMNQGKRVAEELINSGRATHPVIGVNVDLRYFGDGAKVMDSADDPQPVTPGGPGDRAGLRPGDIITEVDGKAIHSGEELIVKIRSRRPGDTMRLTVERDGEQRQVDVTLGSETGD